MIKIGEEKYLGDGLYASHDGFSVTVRTPRENGDHFVVLERPEWNALKQFVKENTGIDDAN